MKLVYPLFALALLGAATTDALRVESTDVAPPADILGEHQELEKTFSVYSEEALEKLSIAIAGPVFITHDAPTAAVAPVAATPAPTSAEPTTEEPVTTEPATPEPTTVEPAVVTETPTEAPTSSPTVTPAATVLIDTDSSLGGSSDGSSSSSGSGSSSSSGSNDTIEFPAIDAVRSLNAASHREETLVATITISGNSSALLDLVEIVPAKKGANNGIRLTYKNTDASAEGFVLTTIQVVEKHALRHLSASVASTVDVASGVLSKEVKEKKIKISSVGASSVFITEDAAIVAQEMDVDVAGSGNVQIVCAASLQLETQLSASVAGSGVVAIHAASIETNELKTSAAGSGSLFVVADTLSAFELSSSVYGSSFASFVATQTGAAQKEKLTIAGSGAVYAGSVVANKSSVDVYGSGVAYVRATEKLKSSSSRSASVYYVGDKPRVVKTSGWFFWRSSVQPAPENKVVTHAVVASPAVYPAYVALSLTKTHRADEPMVVTVDKSNPQEQGQSVNFALLTTHLATVAHGPNGFLVFGSVAAALVAVALVAQSYQQHRQRRHYMPLV